MRWSNWSSGTCFSRKSHVKISSCPLSNILTDRAASSWNYGAVMGAACDPFVYVSIADCCQAVGTVAPYLGPAGTTNVGGDVDGVGHVQHNHVKGAPEGRQDLLQK